MRFLTTARAWRRVLVGGTAAGLLMFAPTAPALSGPLASSSHSSARHNCHAGKSMHPTAPRTGPRPAARPSRTSTPRTSTELAEWRSGALPTFTSRTTGGKIKVHFHVINNGSGIAHGDIPQSQIDAQMQVLRDAYRAGGWKFKLAERHAHHQRELVHDDAGLAGRAPGEDRSPAGKRRRPEHLHGQHRTGAARLGDVPVAATSPTRSTTASSSCSARSPAAARCPTTRATPPPTRSGTGWGCTTRSRADVTLRATW